MFRDIESLREAGVPIEFDSADQKYRIDDSHYLQPTNLTLEEALSVVLMARKADRMERESVLSAAVGAADKIESSLPPVMQDRLREVADAIEFRPAPSNPLAEKGEVYRALMRASVERLTVRVYYDCLTEFRAFESEFHPYHLLFQERSWYAIGYSVRHEEVRTLNLGRIDRVEDLGSAFERPEGWSVQKHLRNAWRLIADDEPDSLIHLRFTSIVARNVAEVIWHPTQRCEFAEGGSLDYYVTVSGLREILWWILGYGDQVEVIEPERLRTLVGRRLRAAADRYSGEGR